LILALYEVASSESANDYEINCVWDGKLESSPNGAKADLLQTVSKTTPYVAVELKLV
jgi:hypothetical protein